MIKEGLLDEVKFFFDKNINSKAIISGIGYKELYSYFNNECSLEEAISKIKQNSRRYAKRQYTFLKHQLEVEWFETNYSNFHDTINSVKEYIDK